MCVCDTMKELNKTKQNKNKKETTEAHERFQTAKQCIRNTKVLCSLHFQLIHDVLETTDSQSTDSCHIWRVISPGEPFHF